MGWQARLSAGHSHAPNNNDSVIIIILAVLYSRGVWEWRVGVLGVARGEWRWWGRDLPGFSSCSPFLSLPISFSSSPSSLVTLVHGARQSLDCQLQLCEASAKCEVVEGCSGWVCWLLWSQLAIERVMQMCPVWVWLVQMGVCDGGRWWVNKRQCECGCAQFPFKAYTAFHHVYLLVTGMGFWRFTISIPIHVLTPTCA